MILGLIETKKEKELALRRALRRTLIQGYITTVSDLHYPLIHAAMQSQGNFEIQIIRGPYIFSGLSILKDDRKVATVDVDCLKDVVRVSSREHNHDYSLSEEWNAVKKGLSQMILDNRF